MSFPLSEPDYFKKAIQPIANWPVEGVTFLDISPLLAQPTIFEDSIDALFMAMDPSYSYNHILALESRGFIFGAPLAQKLSLPFHMARKKGKLPPPVISQAYGLEYGKSILELKANVSFKDQNVLIVDDVIATGGSITAAATLAKQAGAKTVHCLALISLDFLPGLTKLKEAGLNPRALLHY